MIVAVDGPAASGKGTIARAIAAGLGLPYLDTGLLYRAVGVAVLRAGGDPADSAAAVTASGFPDTLLADPMLRGEAAAAAASIVAAHPQVRAALIERQRAFARQPGGAVLDGRDIGTAVAPEADVKLFVIASPEVRAERRHQELTSRGEVIDFTALLDDILVRDARDTGRASAPLTPAADAIVLDTSSLDATAAIAAALAIICRG